MKEEYNEKILYDLVKYVYENTNIAESGLIIYKAFTQKLMVGHKTILYDVHNSDNFGFRVFKIKQPYFKSDHYGFTFIKGIKLQNLDKCIDIFKALKDG